MDKTTGFFEKQGDYLILTVSDGNTKNTATVKFNRDLAERKFFQMEVVITALKEVLDTRKTKTVGAVKPSDPTKLNDKQKKNREKLSGGFGSMIYEQEQKTLDNMIVWRDGFVGVLKEEFPDWHNYFFDNYDSLFNKYASAYENSN